MTERKEEPGGHGDEREPTLPAEEEAAWAQIVAGYGEHPEMPDEHPEMPDEHPDGRRSGRDADGAEDGQDDRADGRRPTGEGETADAEAGAPGADGREPHGDEPSPEEAGRPVRSFTVYSAGTGPRDWQAPDDPDEDHYTPPEPPPLPEADATTKFGWLAAVGGPLLLLGCVLFDVYLSWWIVTLGVGGFLGGFATLLTRLRDGDDEFDDPGSGAVV